MLRVSPSDDLTGRGVTSQLISLFSFLFWTSGVHWVRHFSHCIRERGKIAQYSMYDTLSVLVVLVRFKDGVVRRKRIRCITTWSYSRKGKSSTCNLLHKQRQGLQICVVIYHLPLPARWSWLAMQIWTNHMKSASLKSASLIETPACLVYFSLTSSRER